LLTRPAAKMYYKVAGRTVLIEPFDDWSNQAVSQVFAGWFLNSVSDDTVSQADATLRIRCGVSPPAVPAGLASFEIAHGGTCHTDNQLYYLDFDGSLVVFGEDNSTEINLWVKEPYEFISPRVSQLLSHALSPALRRSHIFEIHSAGVVPPNCNFAVMIAGPSGSGKSTLTSLLASCGWGYLSDDILLLREVGQRIEAQAFRRFFALTADTIAATRIEPSGSTQSGKQRVKPDDHFASGQLQAAIPGIIVFTSVTRGAVSQIIPLASRESMARLLRLCPWASYDKPTSIEHLRLLGQLANSTAAFELRAGADLLQQPRLAEELVLSVVGKTAESYAG